MAAVSAGVSVMESLVLLKLPILVFGGTRLGHPLVMLLLIIKEHVFFVYRLNTESESAQ